MLASKILAKQRVLHDWLPCRGHSRTWFPWIRFRQQSIHVATLLLQWVQMRWWICMTQLILVSLNPFQRWGTQPGSLSLTLVMTGWCRRSWFHWIRFGQHHPGWVPRLLLLFLTLRNAYICRALAWQLCPLINALLFFFYTECWWRSTKQFDI